MTEQYSILELRMYRLAEGTREAFNRRVREVTMPIYRRLGFRCDGFWSAEEDPHTTYYTVLWASKEEMERKWAELLADPEFVASREGYASPVIEHTAELLHPVGRT